MTFNIKNMLKKAWDSACDFVQDMREMRGPYDPAPEVRKKLETKGYSFHDSYVSFPIAVPAKVTYVNAPDGQPIGAFYPDDKVTEQYYCDYNDAVHECRNERKAAQAAVKKGGLKP